MERIRGYVTDILLKSHEYIIVFLCFIFLCVFFYPWYWCNYFEKRYVAIIIIGNPFRKSHR